MERDAKRWAVETFILGCAMLTLLALATYPFWRLAVGADERASWQLVRILWAGGAASIVLSMLIAYRRLERTADGRVLVPVQADWIAIVIWELIGLAVIVVGLVLVVRGPFWDGLILVIVGSGAIALLARRISSMARAKRRQG